MVNLPPVGVLRIEQTVGTVADAALGRFKVVATLRLRQVHHRQVDFQKLNELSVPLAELIQELLERALSGKHEEFTVQLSHLFRADDRERSRTLVLLLEASLVMRDFDVGALTLGRR